MGILINKGDRLAVLAIIDGKIVEQTTAEAGYPPGSFTGKGALAADCQFVKNLIANDCTDPNVMRLVIGKEVFLEPQPGDYIRYGAPIAPGESVEPAGYFS